MSQHVRGDWRVKVEDGITFINKGSEPIARVYQGNEDTVWSLEQMDANARLIAVAPKMYEALKLIVMECESGEFADSVPSTIQAIVQDDIEPILIGLA